MKFDTNHVPSFTRMLSLTTELVICKKEHNPTGQSALSVLNKVNIRMGNTMNRDQVYQEMKEVFGLVPKFFQSIPDSTLDTEWELFKKLQLEDSPIPVKYRELIGIGISAVSKCQFCVFFHTEIARLHGATEEEIENAVHYAKHTAGWSAYLNGSQIDFAEFKDEVRQISAYITENMAKVA